MSYTYKEAQDLIFAALRDAWVGSGETISRVAWPDRKFKPPSAANWMRVEYDIISGNQSGFGTSNKKFRRDGLLSIQLFTPLSGGSTSPTNLAKIVADAFEGVRLGGIWFRTISGPTPVGQSGGFRQTNIAVAFEYDEVK